MSVTSDVVGLPVALLAAALRGLQTIGADPVDAIVTNDFVQTVREVTGNDRYQAERGSGVLAARTCTTADDDVLIVVNWDVMESKTPAELERLLAHEGAHVLIRRRGEEAEPTLRAEFTDPWNANLVAFADVAIEEFRCEAAVYGAGYPVEDSRTDPEIQATLAELNAQTLNVQVQYETVHRSPAQARDEALGLMAYTTRTLGCLAARHLHGHPFKALNLSQHGQANWTELIAPAWLHLIKLLRDTPDATEAWPNPAPAAAAASAIPLMNLMAESFGFLGEPDAFWLRIDEATFNRRLARANDEFDYDPNDPDD